MKRVLSTLIVLLAAASFLTGGDIIDRIAAVVNDEIILLSEVEEKMFILASNGQLNDVDSSQVVQVRREILDRLVEERLVVQRAKSQGIEIDRQEIIAQVDEAMERVRSRFPSLEAFREALKQEGISETMLRERYESDVEQELLGQRVVGQEVRSQVTVTDDDVRKYFEESKEEIPAKPDEIHLAHIVTYPLSSEEEQKAQGKAETARTRVLGGEDFAEVAKDASDDPSAARGGELGWFSKGDLDPSIEAVIDTLKEGQLSAVTRSPFGFHVIEIMARDGERFQVRHLLAMVEVKPEEIDKAKAKAEDAHRRLEAGDAFESVAAAFSEDPLSRENGGDLGWTPAQFLLPQIAAIVDTLTAGDYGPVVQTDRGYHIFKLLERRSGGAYEYDEIQERLKQMLEQTRLEEVYDEWLTAVRDSAYVEIKSWER